VRDLSERMDVNRFKQRCEAASRNRKKGYRLTMKRQGRDGGVKRLSVLMILGFVLSGCGPARYRESADEDTYRIIREKQEEVLGIADSTFTIEKQELPTLIPLEPSPEASESDTTAKKVSIDAISIDDLSMEELRELELSDKKIADLIIPTPAHATTLTLVQALPLSVANSREFQAQKEALFLGALSLTYQRHLWRPQLGLSGSGTGTRQGDEKSVGGDAKFSVGQAIASGAQIALNLGTNFAEFLTGDKRRAIGSILSMTFSQPLLRGGGRLVAMESLTQAERNVIYNVRDFARYRREFSVQVAQNYYQVLASRDNLINTFRNYMSLRRETIQLREMYDQKQAKVTLLDVDEAKQDELAANNAWIFALQTYLDQLDKFKISPLGLPTETPIILDQSELDKLSAEAEGGLPSAAITVNEAVSVALSDRLDLQTAENELEDSERAVALARDALRAGLDINLSSNVGTEEPTKALKFQFEEGTYSGGISLDLPIDRKQERNAYRQALVAYERQKRSLTLFRDNIKLEVRQAYRQLEQARKSYEIQKISVDLAERRVENTKLRQQVGMALSRDVLFATRSLLTAQNALTSALVDYRIARLQLWLSMEKLEVDEKGLWVEKEPSIRGDEDVEGTEQPAPEQEPAEEETSES
jgi:outer membrane protein TolC